ncbi:MULTISPECIES: hypothetical protein [Nocardia]|uniref:hypothetical protein n=1 Tax=Nocardia TaxID=1817 RepID=UPI000D6962E2|nr:MULTISPECIES: hypothetical protein [Nocardia]
MTLWSTALLVWIAAGARVGRVMVKPATTARVAIVVAVASVALAATVAVPEIALAVDNLLPRGLVSGALSDGVVVAAWQLFAVATSVVAAAAWPVVSRVNLRRVATWTYGVGAVTVTLTLCWSFTFGWLVTALASAFVVVTGVRNLDWTTLGRGIAIYTSGTALVAALSAAQIRRAVTDAPRASPGEADWAWPLFAVAALLVALGAIWIVVELWLRARLLLRRIGPLHRTMIERFPEVIAHGRPGASTQLAASDQVAQIMDALYLQSGGGVESVAAGAPPRSIPERAARVAEWARNPLGDIVIDARWIAPPDGVSARGWVRAIARSFRSADRVGARNSVSR